MAFHAELTLAIDFLVNFAQAHALSERPSNTNPNGLIPEYMPRHRADESPALYGLYLPISTTIGPWQF
ncbi:IS30 family transposase [Arthrobacter sp. UYCu511]